MKYIFLILFMGIFQITHSQCEDQIYGKIKVPGICVENMINWFKMPRETWKTEMKKFDFSYEAISESGGTFFTTGMDLHYLGIQPVIKKDFGVLEVNNMPLGKVQKKDIFTNIITELEDYFIKKENGWAYFIFVYTDGISYRFAINQGNNMDLIFLTKLQD